MSLPLLLPHRPDLRRKAPRKCCLAAMLRSEYASGAEAGAALGGARGQRAEPAASPGPEGEGEGSP